MLLIDAAGGVDVARLFLALAAILTAAKLLGELAERIGQPAVLGELVAGVLLGGSVLGVVPTAGAPAELVRVLAELGVVLLLFEIGLETDLREMFRVGAGIARRGGGGRRRARSASATLLGARAPRGERLGGPRGPLPSSSGRPSRPPPSASPRACSPISAGMATAEARIIIGAAVIDDVLGLVILSVVSGVAAGAADHADGRPDDPRGGGRLPGRCGAGGPVPGSAPVRRRRADAGPRTCSWSPRWPSPWACRRWPIWPGRRSSSGPSRPGSFSRAPTSSTRSSTK